MLILGLLLVVAGSAATALLVAYNSAGGPEQTIVLFGRDVASVTPLEAFVSGIVVALVFCLGVWMMIAAGRRSRAVRSEYRAVRREARDATRERDKLADELAKERAATDDATVVTTPPPAEPVAARPTPQERGRHLADRFRRNRHVETVPAEDEPAR